MKLKMPIILVFLILFVSCQDNRPKIPVSELNDIDNLSDLNSDSNSGSDSQNSDSNHFNNDESDDIGFQDSDVEEIDEVQDSDFENPDDDTVLREDVFVSLAIGRDHTCAVTETGSVYCWGSNNWGSLGKKGMSQTRVPLKLNIDSDVRDISCGNSHCYVNTDAGFYKWGDNTFSQLGQKKILTVDYIDTPQRTTIKGVGVQSLTADSLNTFAIDNDGKLYGWGMNFSGQIGDGTTEERTDPVEVDMTGVMKESSVVSVSSGASHTCAVDSIGKVYCWGNNDVGQLGDGTTDNSFVPVEVDMTGDLSGKTVVNVSTGSKYTCVLDIDGNVYCWGVLLEKVIASPSYIVLENPAVSLSVNNSNACALDNEGTVWCWGSNSVGQLGHPGLEDSLDPVEVNSKLGDLKNKDIVDIKMGGNHSCALDSSGDVFCWGSNNNGQVGTGKYTFADYGLYPSEVVKKSGLEGKRISFITCSSTSTYAVGKQGVSYFWGRPDLDVVEYSHIPTLPESEISIDVNSIVSFDAGVLHRCFLEADSSIYCWGKNGKGQLGNNSKENSDIPVEVDKSGVLKGKNITMLSAGHDHTCVLDENGKVYCWGGNNFGQLGNGHVQNSSFPVQVNTDGVLKGKTVKSVQCGSNHTCVLDSNGKTYCWGKNENMQLGDNTPINRSFPVEVNTNGALKNIQIIQLSSGYDHNCGIDDKNQVFCWGGNNEGQLGKGHASPNYYPVKVEVPDVIKEKKLVSIYCGGETTCILSEDGRAYCWGKVTGSGVDGNSPVPVDVSINGALDGKRLVSLDIGDNHVCALDSQGFPYCWGSNKDGQLGSGFLGISNTPYKVFRSISE